MNRPLLFFCSSTLPLFLILTVVQLIQYRDLERVVLEKERIQYELIEKNRRMVVGIMVLSSPQRIDRLAKDQLGLEMITDKQIRLKFVSP